MRVMDVLREGEEAGAGSGGGTGAPQGAPQSGGDADYFREEAKKAFKARDEYKAKVRALEESGRVLTDEQVERYKALEQAAASAEEERKRKAGEFDQWRADITRKHETALQAEARKAQEATERFHNTLRDHAFSSASEWFGGAGAKTILTPEIAAAYFGRYVTVEVDDNGAERVVVKDPNNHVILDAKTGRPAAFTQAIGELIGMLPTRDSILRGSGKTGSGSSGGSGGTDHGVDVDVRRPMTPAELRDPNVRAKVKQQMANAGGLQVAAGLTRR